MYKISVEDWFYSETWNILNNEHVNLILNNYYLIEEFKSMKCFAYDENILGYLLSINNKLDDVKNIKAVNLLKQKYQEDPEVKIRTQEAV